MQSISILIVEDEPELLEAMVLYLSVYCDKIYQAEDGKMALELYKEHLPNIILTDINMPKSNGIEFIQKVRKIDTQVNIIILSAHTRIDDFLEVVPLNLLGYLVKPIQTDKLKEIIFKAIDNISQEQYISLNNDYIWNTKTKHLYLHKKLIELSSYETAFLDVLILSINTNVSYEDIHLYINENSEYSQDAIFTLVKRIRKKTTKELIKSSFKFGYRIESI